MATKHAPMETHWTAFVEHLQKHGLEVEAVDAKVKAFARKRIHRLPAKYRRRNQRQETTEGGTAWTRYS